MPQERGAEFSFSKARDGADEPYQIEQRINEGAPDKCIKEELLGGREDLSRLERGNGHEVSNEHKGICRENDRRQADEDDAEGFHWLWNESFDGEESKGKECHDKIEVGGYK